MQEYAYKAFISYRHMNFDKKVAEKLQKMLEVYKPPKEYRHSKENWRVFRDETELPTSNDLSNDIKSALRNSEFLIVICSKATAQSRWCMEEITQFKELHNGTNENIITLLIDGEPEEVFPKELCTTLETQKLDDGTMISREMTVEPLAANITAETSGESLKKLKREFLRVVAPLLGCGYDDLYNRTHKRKMRQLVAGIAAAFIFITLFGVYNSVMLMKINEQKNQLQAKNEELELRTQELNISNSNLELTNNQLDNTNKELQNANGELDSANTALTKSNADLAEKTKEANDNLIEANHQREVAEKNLEEANLQKEIAEENMRIAMENEAKANAANRNLKIKNSEILANQAKIYYDQDNMTSAIETAIEALPSDDDADMPKSTIAERVLTDATGAYSSGTRMLCNTINLSGYVNFLEFAADGTHILAEDSAGNIYIIDYENDQIIKTYSPLELYNTSYNSSALDICVDGNTGYIYSNGTFVSINLNDGNINWKYNDWRLVGSIATNINSDNIFIPSFSSYHILSKNGSTICNESDNNNYNYGFDDKSYMDNNGCIYATNIADSSIGVLYTLESAWQQFPMPDGEYDEILSMGENKDCLFVNCLLKGEDFYSNNENARLICFNKSDMSIKWQTEYTGDSLYRFYYNDIFNLTHNVCDDNGNYITRDGIIVISGRNILAFDKQTGEQYFKTIMDYGNEILYCEPNEKYTLQLGTKSEYSTYALERHYEGSLLSDDDELMYAGTGPYYNFDKERAYIAHANDTNFALASNNSSEISLYHQISLDSYIPMAGMPTSIGVFDSFTDNENGIFAAYIYDYTESEKKNYIIIYDTNNNQLLSYNEIDISISKMVFVTDKLFIVDDNGIAEILDFSGNVQNKLDLGKAFREQNNLPEDKYLLLYDPYITKIENSVLYCIGDGMLKVNLSDDIAETKKCSYYNSIIDGYSISNNFISFMAKDKGENKIGYFEMGNESNISCVQDNNNDFVYQYGAVSSLINTDNRNLIAFINNEGYIGIYKCGDNSMSKIMIARDEAVPLKIQFSPDAKYILAICANGEFIKYSVDTLERVSKSKVEFPVYSDTTYEFIDDDSFFVKSIGGDLQIFDFYSMELKGVVDNYMYFMKKDKKILCKDYSSEIPYGYYKYLTTEELIERGKGFLAGIKKY